jgi:CheY-like chemotaxis protein
MKTRPQPHILIVDDSSTARALMRRVIILSGISADNVCEAADGRHALALMSQRRIDVVLADLQMPEMDGEEMSRRIFADPTKQHVSVIVISADPNQERIESLLREGAKGYLAKPFTPEAFQGSLVALLGGTANA